MKSDVKKNSKAEKTLKLRDLIAPKCEFSSRQRSRKARKFSIGSWARTAEKF